MVYAEVQESLDSSELSMTDYGLKDRSAPKAGAMHATRCSLGIMEFQCESRSLPNFESIKQHEQIILRISRVEG